MGSLPPLLLAKPVSARSSSDLADSCGHPELSRRDADYALEVVRELALVREPGDGGDLRQGQVHSCLRQPLGRAARRGSTGREPSFCAAPGEETQGGGGSRACAARWPLQEIIVPFRNAPLLRPCAFESNLARFDPTDARHRTRKHSGPATDR